MSHFHMQNHVHQFLGKKGVILSPEIKLSMPLRQKKLQCAFQNKRSSFLSDSINLLYNSNRLHVTHVTQNFIESFGQGQMNHAQYSSDMVSSDFHLFLHLKQLFSGQHFDDDEEVKDAITSWLNNCCNSLTFYHVSIQNLEY